MKIISSKTDIETYLDNERPDLAGEGLAGAVVEAIQDEDHPDFGLDWEDWLTANLEPIVQSCLDAAEPE